MVGNVMMKENLLKDLQLFNSARRDADGTAIQAFVADCMDQVNTDISSYLLEANALECFHQNFCYKLFLT